MKTDLESNCSLSMKTTPLKMCHVSGTFKSMCYIGQMKTDGHFRFNLQPVNEDYTTQCGEGHLRFNLQPVNEDYTTQCVTCM